MADDPESSSNNHQKIMKTCKEIRQSFLDYFAGRKHRIVPGASLVPGNDPSLLFTSAGMVQFKDVFLGIEPRPALRAVTVQRCVRAGGKHNDLEQVGHTARHHTFFEMLGNFSFGDYFKEQAIEYAWQYLTEVLALPAERLWVTVYQDDQESARIWRERIGIPAERFSACGAEHNFWTMGETGPCGPCSEIYYDHGADIPGAPPGSAEKDGDRYVEIWNLVFTQYQRDKQGVLKPIPHPSVDTGMGLERIAAVLQGVHNNYDSDAFQSVLHALQALARQSSVSSLRVIADHIRAIAFLICDGVTPGNEGRDYVLRRIIRRAVRHGHKLGISGPFLHKLLPALEESMGDFYPFLEEKRCHIEDIVRREEQRFGQTLEQGLKLMMELVDTTPGRIIPGESAFRLYDTYGFPLDLSADIAREHGMEIDEQGFNGAMAEQRRRAREASRFGPEEHPETTPATNSSFSGYALLEQKARVTELYQNGQQVDTLQQGDSGGVILPETPFYARAGGQVGDRGELTIDGGGYFEVQDTCLQGQACIHLGVLRAGTLKVGDKIMASVSPEHRARVMRNHSATHLLHAALRRLLGDQVVQKGSLVAADRLRFDFSFEQPLTLEQIEELERMITRQILQNSETVIQQMPLEKARQSGAMMLFGEKYADPVRVLSIGGTFSRELCGGTHVARCGDIGLFKIIAETGIAAGVRRIEALTGDTALDWVQKNTARLDRMALMLKTEPESAEERLSQQLGKVRTLEKELSRLRSQLVSNASEDMLATATEVMGIKVLAQHIEGADSKTLRETVQRLKDRHKGIVALLATVSGEGRISLVAGVAKDSVGRIQAVELVNYVARQVGGRGGGQPDLAQAGGTDPDALAEALAGVPDWVSLRLETADTAQQVDG